MKKRVKLIPVYLLVFSLFAPCTTQASTNITHSTYTATPQKISISPRRGDVIEWRYKTVNGVLYKRKYNKRLINGLASGLRLSNFNSSYFQRQLPDTLLYRGAV